MLGRTAARRARAVRRRHREVRRTSTSAAPVGRPSLPRGRPWFPRVRASVEEESADADDLAGSPCGRPKRRARNKEEARPASQRPALSLGTPPCRHAVPVTSPLWGLQRVCANRATHGRAGGPNVERDRPPARERTPELENGDRGGWPPFSKHRCLGRGGCPSHCRCAPGGGARAESHGLTTRRMGAGIDVRGQRLSRRESGAHAQCLHPGGGRGAGPAGRSDRLRARPGHPRCPDDRAGGPRRLGGPADRGCVVPEPVRRLHQARGQLPLRLLRAGRAGPPLHGPPRGTGPGGVPADGADHGPVRSPGDGGAGGAARRARTVNLSLHVGGTRDELLRAGRDPDRLLIMEVNSHLPRTRSLPP